MRKLRAAILMASLFGFASGLSRAEDHNADMGANGAQGVPSAWDTESIDILSGNVHLTIPLYSVQTGDNFGLSVALQYDSKVWDASDLNYPNRPSNRSLIAKSVFGLGWKAGFGRVYSLTYANGPSTEAAFYFQDMGGATHRLYRKYNWVQTGLNQEEVIEDKREHLASGAAPYRVIGRSICDANPDLCEGGGGAGSPPPPDPYPGWVCQGETYWYAYDGSGIRAEFNADSWTVWIPDGTRYRLTHFMDNDLNTPEQASYKGWYTTSVESAVRQADGITPMHSLTINYVDPALDNARRYCPVSIADDLGRTVNFNCQATTANGTVIDGGVVRSITVPAPHGGTLTYQLNYLVKDICDPLDYDGETCSSKHNILLLDSVSAMGVTPSQDFAFDYSSLLNMDPSPGEPIHFITGDIRFVSLPGGAGRTYTYGTYRVWQKDHPIIYTNTSQFSYFPVRALVSRQVQVDGKTWQWDYQRDTDSGCSVATPQNCCTVSQPQNCYNLPKRCVVKGPYDPQDSTVSPSSVVYGYNATKASAGTPSPLDGTLSVISVYAGDLDAGGQNIRFTQFVYESDAPVAGTCNASSFLKGHGADNIRVRWTSTTITDDVPPPGETQPQRIVENSNWVSITPNFGRYQQVDEQPCCAGAYRYRRTVSNFTLTSAQVSNWVLTPVTWTRIFAFYDGIISETDFVFDQYGRPTSTRKLYAPGASPMNQTADDILTTFSYSAANGNLSQTTTKIAGQATGFTQVTDAWDAGLPSRQRFSGAGLSLWYTLDVDRDLNTGLPVQSRQPWKTGVSLTYDALGRPTNVTPLSGSGDPPTTFTYAGGETSVTTGDPASNTSIQQKIILDGLGRTKEERVLKFDDALADQWVTRIYTRDPLGNVSTVSEWVPVGTANPPKTTIERFGTYGGGSQVGFDPFFRVRRVVRPDGSQALTSYQGLQTTTTVPGIQGGTISVPSLLTAVTTQTQDIFGRVIKITPPTGGAVIDADYDELDRLKEVRTNGAQPRTTVYDPLGRVKSTSDPERGNIWFGSHIGVISVNPDGYNALGQVVRYQNQAGYPGGYHYLLTYDPAGRPLKIEKELETTPFQKKKIAEYVYDLASNGTGAGSYLGRQSRMMGYDDNEMVVSKTDFYYTEAFGRLDHLTTVFDAWDGTMGNLGGAGSSDTAMNTYYSYDALGQVQTMTYPTTGGAGAGSSSTYLSFTRRRGFVNDIYSPNRGASIVYNALYGDNLGLKEWNGGGMQTKIIADDPIRSRIHEITVGDFLGIKWTSGVYTYDGGGNISSVWMDKYRYDALGRLTAAQVFDNSGGTFRTESFAYDTFGNIQSKTSAFNYQPATTTTYNLDAATNRIRGLGAATNWTYRTDGALTHDDNFNYTYDGAGRLYQVLQGATELGRYFYDAAGLRVHRQENHGRTVFSFRDPDGNVLSQFSRPTGTTLLPQWDRDFVYFAGQRVSMIEKPAPATVAWKLTKSINSGQGAGISLEWYPNPETTLYGYLVERKGPGETQFTPMYDATGVRTTTGTTKLDAAVVDGQTYTYRVLAMDVNGTQGNYSAEKVITFKDTMKPNVPLNVDAEAGQSVVVLTWTEDPPPIDLAGFYIRRKAGNGSFSTLNSYPITDLYYYDSAVTPGTTYTYKVVAADNADLRSDESFPASATPGNGAWNDQDLENEAGVRFASLFGEDQFDRLPVTTGVGNGTPEIASAEDRQSADGKYCPLTSSPYQVVGQLVGARILWLHSDHLGNLRLVTSWGYVITNHKYLPFGEEIQPMHSLDPFKYAGYERDPESGMDYVRARYYIPARGRWLTPDPLGGGYVYADNMPTTRSDPSGLGIQFYCHKVCFSVSAGGGPASTPTCEWACDYFGIDERERRDPPIKDKDRENEHPERDPKDKKTRPKICESLAVQALLNSPAPVMFQANALIPLPQGLILPLAIDVAYVPQNGTLYYGGGIGGSFPSPASASFGPLTHYVPSTLGSVLQGFSMSGTAQLTPAIGYQGVWNTSGSAGGPSTGLPGLSLSAGFNFTFNLQAYCK